MRSREENPSVPSSSVYSPEIDFVGEEYVLEELNVRSLVPCNDTLKYASLKAEPDFSVLGRRLGSSMKSVAGEIKKMSQQDILRFEEAGEVTIANHTLNLADIKVSHAIFFFLWNRVKNML